METFIKITDLVSVSLRQLPPLVEGEDLAAWENSFASRSLWLRMTIGNLIVLSGDGHYEGRVGDHGLSLCGISVRVKDGYRALLQHWLATARASAGQRNTSASDASPQLAAIARELLAFVEGEAARDPVFAKGHEKQRIAAARALVAKAGAA